MAFTGPVAPTPFRLFPALLACTLALLIGGCAAQQQSADGSPTPARTSVPTGGSPGAGPTSTRATTTSTSSATAPAQVDCRKKKCVALTFDDGPGPLTDGLLDTLVKENVPATFFLVGNMIKQHPGVARRIASTPGMTIADHTISHPMLTKLGAAAVKREIVGNTRLIRNVTGVSPRFLRPPNGLHDARVDDVARRQGQAVVLWSAGALDWQYDTPAKIVSVTMPQLAPGAIVLAHDIHPWTVKAVPTLITKIRAKGYTLVSLDDILGGHPKAGLTYARGEH